MPHQEEIRAWMHEMEDAGQLVAQTVASPSSGSNIQMTQNSRNGFLRIGAGPALASLSITHPSDAVSQDSQIRSIYFDRDIASISWPGSNAGNLPSSAAAGDSCTTQRLEPGKWVRRY